MRRDHHYLPVSVLLIVAMLLGGCITVKPGALGPEATATPGDVSAFTAQMIGALLNRDFAQLQSMMGDPFVIAAWTGEGESFDLASAVERIKDELSGDTLTLTFVAPSVIEQWTSGVDPLTLWPADVKPVSTIGISGLGQDGKDQALLIIAQYPDGSYYWYALLVAAGGFEGKGGSQPPSIIVIKPGQPVTGLLPTDVDQVLVLGPVGIFDGPGAQFNQIGVATRGQVYDVLGASPDGQWWAVRCADLAAPCWISANPTFVRPVTFPGPSPTATATRVPATPTRAPATATPRPTATAVPPQPPIRLQFGPGQDTVVVNGLAGPNQSPQYVLYGFAGDNLRILLSSSGGVVNFSLRGMTDGVLYKSINDRAREWTMRVPRSQDYLLTVASGVNAYFTMEVSLFGVTPPTSTPPPTPTRVPPTATAIPSQPERIEFMPGQESAVRSGPLWANTPKQYVFFGAAGQQATIRLSSPSPAANFIVVGAQDGIPYKSQGNSARDFTFVLPRSQDYLITILAPVNTSYTLQLIIPRPGPTPTRVPQAERINFAPGETTAVRSGYVYVDNPKLYVFRALSGQTAFISLSVPWGDASFEVRGVDDGVVYKPLGNPALDWSFVLPRTQDYTILIVAAYDTAYSLQLTIPSVGPTPTLSPPTPIPPTVVPPTVVPQPPERINFMPGQETAVRSGPLPAFQAKSYVFFASAGQDVTIQLDSPSPAANFTVVGVSDGNPYKSQGNSAQEFSFTAPASQDYLITIAAPVNTSYTLMVTIPNPGPTPIEPTPGLPTMEPPTMEPPTVEPPTVEPPTVEPPTVEPPTVEPPTVEPPTVEPPTGEPVGPIGPLPVPAP